MKPAFSASSPLPTALSPASLAQSLCKFPTMRPNTSVPAAPSFATMRVSTKKQPPANNPRGNASNTNARPARPQSGPPTRHTSPTPASASQPPHPVQPPSSTVKRQRKPTVMASRSDYDRAIQLSHKRGSKAAARRLFESATRTYPKDGRLWVAWGQMEQRAGNRQRAHDIFRDGMSHCPENSRILHAWAIFEEKRRNFKQARTLFNRCLKLSPNDGVVWQSLALLEERLGNTNKARQVFRHGVERDPGNHFLYSAWAVLEHRHSNYQPAHDLFERALALNASHIRTYQAFAITCEKLALFDKSLLLFTQALRINEGSVPTYQAFALFQNRRGNYDQARALFEKGLSIDSDHIPILHAWATMEFQLGNYTVARSLFQRGISIAPENTPLLRAWARMELELGHIDKGIDWIVPSSGYKKQLSNGKVHADTASSSPSDSEDSDTERRSSKPGQARRNDSSNRSENLKQINVVSENLMMLRLMLERKSDDDMKTVMQWMDGRANAFTERQTNDVQTVKEWVRRRSEGDIQAFKSWLDARYEKDRRIGVYVFNWDIAQPQQQEQEQEKEQQKPVEKPIEWLHLDDIPEKTLQSFDEDVYLTDKTVDYAEGLYFIGDVTATLVNRAALVLCLGALSGLLVATSARLQHLGYTPGGQQGQIEAPTTDDVSPPSGVDAYLFEDGGAESMVDEILQQNLARSSQ